MVKGKKLFQAKETMGCKYSLISKLITIGIVPIILLVVLFYTLIQLTNEFESILYDKQTKMVTAQCAMLDCDKDFFQTYVGYLEANIAENDEDYAKARASIEKNIGDVEERIQLFKDTMEQLFADNRSIKKEELWTVDEDTGETWYYSQILEMYDSLIPVWKASLEEGKTHDNEVFNTLRTATNNLGKIAEDTLQNYIDRVSKSNALQKGIFEVVFIVIIILFAGLAVNIIRSIQARTRLVNREITKISELNMADGYEPLKKERDEFAIILRNIAKMRGVLNNTIFSIKEISCHVESASNQLQDHVSVIDSATENVFTSMKQFIESASIQNDDADAVKKNAEQMGELIHNMDEYVDKLMFIAESMNGNKNHTMDSMIRLEKSNEECAESIRNIYQQIQETSKSVEKIGVVTSTITSIAKQTNLLALNASIEAARAGDAGNGFAVVAEEIRNLAEGSNNSAKEISNQIAQMLDKFQVCCDVMNQVNQQMMNQIQVFMDTKGLINNLSSGITDAVQSIEQMQEQSSNLSVMKKQVSDSISSLAVVIEDNSRVTQNVLNDMEHSSRVVEKITNSVQILRESSTNLDHKVEIFHL